MLQGNGLAEFQSALAPKDERYGTCNAVPARLFMAVKFQSALAPKDERYLNGHDWKPDTPVIHCFNPLSPRRTRDTRYVGAPSGWHV